MESPERCRRSIAGKTRRLIIALLVLAAFVLLTWGLLIPLSTSPASRLYDAGTFTSGFLSQPDVTLNAWILAWDTHVLSTGRIGQLFHANIFYPEPSALAFSEHMLGVFPLFGPLYLATGQLALSLNLWIMSTFVLCGLAMYWASLRWLESHLAAAIAAVTYAFAPWRFLELAHVQMLSVQYLPLLVYVIWESGRRRDLLLWLSIAGLATIQSLSGYYLGYMAFTIAGVVTGALVLVQPAPRIKRLLFVGSALCVAALVMVPFSLPYVELGRDIGFAEKLAMDSLWKAVAGYLFPGILHPESRSWYAWNAIPWIALAGAFIGLVSRRYRALTVALCLVGLAGAWLGMGWKASVLNVRIGAIDDFLSGLIPGWSALRVINRFAILCWLAMSVLVAIPFADQVRWLRSFTLPRLLLGIILICSVLVSTIGLKLQTRPAPEVSLNLTPYQWLAKHGDGDPVLEWPMLSNQVESEYMYCSSFHWLPLVNGYSGYQPPWKPMMLSLARSLPEPEAARSLSKLNVARWLVVHGNRPGWGRRRWGQLAHAGGKLRVEGDDFRIYELPFKKHHPPLLPGQGRPEASILGTPIRPLRVDHLQAKITPLTKSARSRVAAGLPLSVRIQNLSSIRWPGVAIDPKGLVGLVFKARRPGTTDEQTLGDLQSRGSFHHKSDFHRLPADPAPRQAIEVWSTLVSPLQSGVYEVVPCLVQSGQDLMRCFEDSRIRLEVGDIPVPPPL